MSRELIEPNLHVILIHGPLGLLAVGTFIEFFAPLFWRRSIARAAGRWMILLGALTIAPVAAAGLYAMADLNHAGEAPWIDARAASPIQGHAWEMMKEHALFNAAGGAVLLLLVVIWLAASDKIRLGLHLVFLLLLLGGVGTIFLGAWHGGEMVYLHGVGVRAAGGEEFANHKHIAGWREVENYAPPLELHVILAGAAIAAGLAAIGASMRGGTAVTAMTAPPQPFNDIGYALNAGARSTAQYNTAAQLHAMEDPAMYVEVQRPRVGRYWLLAALVAICALLVGWWTLASGSEIWKPKDLWDLVRQNAEAKEYRRIAHVAVGGTIVLLMLLSGLVARASGKRIVIGFFSLLLLAAVGVQGWLGALMLLDTTSGSVVRLNQSAMEKPAPKPATVPATRRATTLATVPASSNAKAPAQGPG